ncbi:hypothetical protein [Nocardia sp. IFM 10818]
MSIRFPTGIRMAYPTPYKVRVIQKRDHTDDIRPVIGWAAPDASKAAASSFAETVIDLELYVPPAFLENFEWVGANNNDFTAIWLPKVPGGPLGDKDPVVKYWCVGPPEVAAGPGGWKPGALINLRRAV